MSNKTRSHDVVCVSHHSLPQNQGLSSSEIMDSPMDCFKSIRQINCIGIFAIGFLQGFGCDCNIGKVSRVDIV